MIYPTNSSPSKPLLSILLLVLVTMFSVEIYAQDHLVRSFDASCSEVCDGSAEFMDFVNVPERYYKWMSEEEGRYHSMNQPILDGLCPGRYRIRQIKVMEEKLEVEAFKDSSLLDFEGVHSFTFNTIGKREVSLYMKLDQEVNHLNYYIRAQHSLDGGKTWKRSSQFHQKILQEIGGGQQVFYMMNLSSSANERKEVKVRLFQRKSENPDERAFLSIRHAHIESKEFEEYNFQIRTKHSLRIQSTVSNELEGSDGYISLELQGGSPPYACTWEDGSTSLTRTHLAAGSYSVDISDSKNCRQNSRYVVLPPSGTELEGEFGLEQIDDSDLYMLDINNIYRQPVELQFNTPDSTLVKMFKINPLSEDLHMDLDLSFLESGEYRVTLSTMGFSKNISLRID